MNCRERNLPINWFEPARLSICQPRRLSIYAAAINAAVFYVKSSDCLFMSFSITFNCVRSLTTW